MYKNAHSIRYNNNSKPQNRDNYQNKNKEQSKTDSRKAQVITHIAFIINLLQPTQNSKPTTTQSVQETPKATTVPNAWAARTQKAQVVETPKPEIKPVEEVKPETKPETPVVQEPTPDSKPDQPIANVESTQSVETQPISSETKTESAAPSKSDDVKSESTASETKSATSESVKSEPKPKVSSWSQLFANVKPPQEKTTFVTSSAPSFSFPTDGPVLQGI